MKNSNKTSNSELQDTIEKEHYTNRVESPAEENNTILEDTEKVENDENMQETIVKPESEITSINYLGIGILSISSIFLITTIIIAIFLKKYQLKVKTKSSK